MGLAQDGIKPLLRFLSAAVGVCLLSLSVAGFHHLTTTKGTFEGQSSFGCLCFLGVIFGALLALGETKWEWFFFLFGFMRYRIGRAIVFSVAGIMIALIGKNMDDQCDCQTYVLLIIEGIACLVMAGLQLLAILSFGNNSAPARKYDSDVPSSSRSRRRSSNKADEPIARPSKTIDSAPSTAFQPVVIPQPAPAYVPPAPAPAAVVPNEVEDPNMPAWMRA